MESLKEKKREKEEKRREEKGRERAKKLVQPLHTFLIPFLHLRFD